MIAGQKRIAGLLRPFSHMRRAALLQGTGIKEKLYPEVPLEFFAEDLKPPVGDLFAQLP